MSDGDMYALIIGGIETTLNRSLIERSMNRLMACLIVGLLVDWWLVSLTICTYLGIILGIC